MAIVWVRSWGNKIPTEKRTGIYEFRLNEDGGKATILAIDPATGSAINRNPDLEFQNHRILYISINRTPDLKFQKKHQTPAPSANRNLDQSQLILSAFRLNEMPDHKFLKIIALPALSTNRTHCPTLKP